MHEEAEWSFSGQRAKDWDRAVSLWLAALPWLLGVKVVRHVHVYMYIHAPQQSRVRDDSNTL